MTRSPLPRVLGPEPGTLPRWQTLILDGDGLAGSPWPAWLDPGRGLRLLAAPGPPCRADGGQVVAWFEASGHRVPAVSQDSEGPIVHFDLPATAASLLSEGYLRHRRPLHTYVPWLVSALPGPVRLKGHALASKLEALRSRQPRPRTHAGSPPGPKPCENRRNSYSDNNGLSRCPEDSGRSPKKPAILPGLARGQAETALLSRIQDSNGFPEFPLERSLLALQLLWRWALGQPAGPGGLFDGAVLLCHDVDTALGQTRMRLLAREEERLGLRSCFFIVGDRFAVDHGLLDRLRQAGHEIGLHGARHDQRLAFLPPVEIERRLDRCRGLCERHGLLGFRSPALLTSPALTRALHGRFLYDSSVPHSDLDAVSAPRRGCASLHPFFQGELLQIPLTLPLDDRLLLLGLDPDEVHRAWLAMMRWIRLVGGLCVLTNHAEPHLGGSARMVRPYRQFLEALVEEGFQTALPREVAIHYQARSPERLFGLDPRCDPR